MTTAKDTAMYFIARAIEDEDPITNLKLQKLLYYAQGFHLAVFEQPLFNDPIEAWQHGPVVPSMYHEYKGYGANPITDEDAPDEENFDPDSLELLDEVYEVYGQFSAGALRNMTHREPPWRDTPPSEVISWDSLKAFFKTRITE